MAQISTQRGRKLLRYHTSQLADADCFLSISSSSSHLTLWCIHGIMSMSSSAADPLDSDSSSSHMWLSQQSTSASSHYYVPAGGARPFINMAMIPTALVPSVAQQKASYKYCPTINSAVRENIDYYYRVQQVHGRNRWTEWTSVIHPSRCAFFASFLAR